LTRVAPTIIVMYLMTKQIVASAAVAFGLLVGGCGDSNGLNPREGCERLVEVLCHQIYSCFSDAERMADGFPATEASCVMLLQDDSECAQETDQNACPAGQTYHGNEAESCVNQIGALSCAQVRDSGTDLQAAAPSCGRVCTVE
jgi:hypothetical protein